MGWPIFWTHINVEQTDDQKASAARSTNEWRKLLQMRLSEWFDAPPRGLQQATERGDSVPGVSREAPRRRNETEASCLPNLQGDIQAKENGPSRDLSEAGVPVSEGRGGCRQTLGQSTNHGAMRVLQDGVPQDAATPNDVRSIMREQAGMAEQAMSNRPQRLKCCGNGVVALQAAAAVVQLVQRANGVTAA
jgi:hypothetical protein